MGFISGICIFEFLTVSLKTVTLKIFNNRHNLPLPPPPDICSHSYEAMQVKCLAQ